MKTFHKNILKKEQWVDICKFVSKGKRELSDGLFEIFGNYSDEPPHTVCDNLLGWITDGKTDRCGSCYMSLCAICFAVPLVAVRLNYKFVTKSCVFTDHFNQSNFHFCDNTNGLIYFKYIILMP